MNTNRFKLETNEDGVKAIFEMFIGKYFTSFINPKNFIELYGNNIPQIYFSTLGTDLDEEIIHMFTLDPDFVSKVVKSKKCSEIVASLMKQKMYDLAIQIITEMKICD